MRASGKEPVHSPAPPHKVGWFAIGQRRARICSSRAFGVGSAIVQANGAPGRRNAPGPLSEATKAAPAARRPAGDCAARRPGRARSRESASRRPAYRRRTISRAHCRRSGAEIWIVARSECPRQSGANVVRFGQHTHQDNAAAGLSLRAAGSRQKRRHPLGVRARRVERSPLPDSFSSAYSRVDSSSL